MHPDYPLEIDEAEKQADFRRFRIYGIADLDFPETWVEVVCRELDQSDVIVKTVGPAGLGVIYSHRRFGVRTLLNGSVSPEAASWHPMGEVLLSDLSIAVIAAKLGENEKLSGARILPQAALKSAV